MQELISRLFPVILLNAIMNSLSLQNKIPGGHKAWQHMDERRSDAGGWSSRAASAPELDSKCKVSPDYTKLSST